MLAESETVSSATFAKGELKLPKSERLHHKSMVNRLFDEGDSIYSYPLKLVYHIISEEELKLKFTKQIPDDIDSLQMMITIPKKKQRKAVARVSLRRRIREAYRLHRLPLRSMLLNQTHQKYYLSIAFLYQSEKIYKYAELEERMIKLLSRLSATIADKIKSEETTDIDT